MENDFLQALTSWVAAHRLWAGCVLFGIAFAEALAGVGLMVPGVALLFGIGVLIGAGSLSFWPMVAWAATGAFLGDSLSYWLGFRFRHRLRSFWPFSKHPKMLTQGAAFFARYGGASIFIGRFFGPVRGMIPLVAGMLSMPRRRFFPIEAISALLWAPAYLLPGVFFGASLGLAAEVAWRLVVMLVLLLGCIGLVVWLILRIFNFLQPRAHGLLLRVLRWGPGHRYLGELSATLADPKHPEAKGLFAFGLVLLATTWWFVWIFSVVGLDNALARLDQGLYQLLQGLRTPTGDQIMVAITQLADTPVLLVFAVTISFVLLGRGHRFAFLHWLAAFGFALVASFLLKNGLQVPRPPQPPGGLQSFSFPSGHTLAACCLYGFLAVLLARSLPMARRWIPYVLCGGVISAVALSRLYLGAHWLSDVLGGLSLGLAWVSLLGIAYRCHPSPSLPRGALLATLLALMPLGAIYMMWQQEAALQRYALYSPMQSMAKEAWWQSQWHSLPAYRDDLVGGRVHPLTVQWAGSRQAIKTVLAQQGWLEPEAAGRYSWLALLNPNSSLAQMPVLPQVHAGRYESLVLVLYPGLGERRWVFRLWPSAIRFEDDTPLWVGNISSQAVLTQTTLLAYPQTGADFNSPLQMFMAKLSAVTWLRQQRLTPEISLGQGALAWAGGVVLITQNTP